jgi:hypothetical protein
VTGTKLLNDAARLWRFATELRRYLEHPISTAQALQIVRARMTARPEILLRMARSCIYDNPRSPYLWLLQAAGCDYGDLESLVRHEGVEGALRTLAARGVYLTIDELKARTLIRRGNAEFAVREADFANPVRAGHLAARTGASRSPGSPLYFDFENLADKFAVHQALRLQAFGALDLPTALWLPIMPGAGPVSLLSHAKAGQVPERWFSPVERRGFRPSLVHRFGTFAIVEAGRLSGVRLPRPEYIGLDEASRVAAWMREAIGRAGGCTLFTYASTAVRACQAAVREGWDLSGAIIKVTGEPLTEAKHAEIEACGATARPVYAFMEAGTVAVGCLRPASVDDCHLFADAFALIAHARDIPRLEMSVDAFLFTALLDTSPKILFNAENGDFGLVESRACGCPLDREGCSPHVRQIRSFEKLTGEGMSFLGTEVIRIVEEVLPARFGGDSTRYQFVEEEDAAGLTRMTLRVSPAVGPVDEAAAVACVREALARGSDGSRMMAAVWETAGTLRVSRTEPSPTARGKILPLHIAAGREGPARKTRA